VTDAIAKGTEDNVSAAVLVLSWIGQVPITDSATARA
jgi:hypothetical protein